MQGGAGLDRYKHARLPIRVGTVSHYSASSSLSDADLQQADSAKTTGEDKSNTGGSEEVEKDLKSSDAGDENHSDDPDDKDKASAKAKSAPRIKPLDIVVPEQIGRYTIGRRIGSGTCGVVHQSLDNLLGREVAVKLSPVGQAHESTGKVPGAQRAYQTEIIAAGKLTHPNIVTVYDAGQYEDLNFLVMEAVEGKTLKEYGKGKTLLPVGEALRIISACCLALDYSHKQGILHRDIKPANIMLSYDGSVKLLDFGIAVGLTDNGALKKQGPTLGTPNYMSPEQILGRELTAQSDFYSLATVLFELLTGRQLFKAKKVKELFRAVVHQKAPSLTSIRPDLPEGLSQVLARALAKRPGARFQTGLEMVKALKPFYKSFKSVEQRPVSQQRLIRQLRLQTFFKGFSEAEVALLLERVSVRTFDAGAVVLQKGVHIKRLLVITDGAVKSTSNGRVTALVGAGECIGETGFIHGTAEPNEHVALTSVSALQFTTDALAQLPPKVHLHYYRYISDVLLSRLAKGQKPSVDLSL